MLYFSAYVTNQPNIFQITPQGELTPLAEMGFNAWLIGGRNGLLFGVNGADIFTLRSRTTTTIFTHPRPNPWFSNVLLARDGNLYGTVIEFGPNGRYSSSFFQLTPSGVFIRLNTSEVFGQLLYRELFEGSDGNFYGTALLQGNTISRVFRISPDGTFSTLTSVNFGQLSDGLHLIQGRDGLLYGFLQDFNSNILPGSGRLFRLVPTPNISVRQVSSGGINLTWNSFTGGVYGIEYKTSLSDLDWKPLIPDMTAKSELTSFMDNPRDANQRYYRVRLMTP